MDYPENFEHNNSGDFLLPELFMERPRLSQLFEQAMQHQFITVCAGAGYGKTSAVYSFIRNRNALVNWIHLSESDNMEESFWDNYIHTVYKVVSPELMDSVLQIGVPKTKYDYEKYFSFIGALYQKLVTKMNAEYIFVFDDLHLITNPHVLQFIDLAIRYKATNKTSILISRKDPLILLPHLAAEGIIPSVTEEDLHFTESETAEYLRTLGISISTQGVQTIFKDTRGWAFALTLIGRSLLKSPEYRNDVFGAMQNNVFRIFEAEIFSVISDRLKKFLIRLSLLDRLPAVLLREIASDGALVTEMEQQSAYIRYDPYMNTYIIHHLLLNYLHDQQHLLNDEDKRDTYKKAGDYCARNNYKADAIAYYEKAGEYGALLTLVYNEISMQIPQDIAENLLKIFENAPETTAKTVDLFPVLHLRTLLSLGRITEATALGQRYIQQFLALPETPRTTTVLASIYLNMGIAREFQLTVEDKCDFSEYYAKHEEFYNKNPFPARGASTIMMAGTWVSTAGAARAGAPEEFIAESERSEQSLIRAQNGYGAGRSDIAAGELMFYRNDVKEAEIRFTQGIQKARAYRQPSLVAKALSYLMHIAFMRGNAADAARALSGIKDLLSEEEYIPRYATYDVACGWYYLKLGQPELVPDWLKSDFLPYAHPKFLENLGNQTKMLYCFATKNYPALLNFTARRKERETALFERLESLAFEACVYYLMKDRNAAFETLREAYETAYPNRLVTPLIEMGKDMRTLAAAAMREDGCKIPNIWLKSLGRQASVYAKYQSHIITSGRDEEIDEIRLSGREKDILAGLSKGLTRAEIAENLGLSPNTVKMITENLYVKIGASNMADAIRIGVGKNLI